MENQFYSDPVYSGFAFEENQTSVEAYSDVVPGGLGTGGFEQHQNYTNFQPQFSPNRFNHKGQNSRRFFHHDQGNKTTTLFLGDLSVLCNEENLYDLFRQYGEIDSVQLKKSDRDPQRAHLGYGFIKFGCRESAEKAIRELNGLFFLGRAIRVGWADDYDKRNNGRGGGPPGGMISGQDRGFMDPKKQQRPTAQIHVMFVSREMNKRVSELDLGNVFSRFGNLVDIAIKKNAINPDLRVQSGYAFVHFTLSDEGVQSAVAAVEQTSNRTFDSIAYQCKVTHSLQAHIFSLKHRGLPTPPSHPGMFGGQSMGLMNHHPSAASAAQGMYHPPAIIHNNQGHMIHGFNPHAVPQRFDSFGPPLQQQRNFAPMNQPVSLGSSSFDGANFPYARSFPAGTASFSGEERFAAEGPNPYAPSFVPNSFFPPEATESRDSVEFFHVEPNSSSSLSMVNQILGEEDDVGTTSVSATSGPTQPNTRNGSIASTEGIGKMDLQQHAHYALPHQPTASAPTTSSVAAATTAGNPSAFF